MEDKYIYSINENRRPWEEVTSTRCEADGGKAESES